MERNYVTVTLCISSYRYHRIKLQGRTQYLNEFSGYFLRQPSRHIVRVCHAGENGFAVATDLQKRRA